MEQIKDPFDNGYGTIRVEKSLISTVLRRYPRKIGPVLEDAFDLRLRATRMPFRIRRAAVVFPPTRKVLIIGVEVPSRAEMMAQVAATLPRSRHKVTFAVKAMENRPKFDNVNDLLRKHFTPEFDWLIITDDDIAIPPHFLDDFIYLLERFEFKIGQPAHKLRSYACYLITRRNWGTVARQTNFVEIGPLVALHRDTFADLIPFPDVGMGWGLDYHWGLVAREKGWRIGIIDALPIQHLCPIGSGYAAKPALIQAQKFLDAHGGLSPKEALKTLRALRSV
jgi:hypothetical protein